MKLIDSLTEEQALAIAQILTPEQRQLFADHIEAELEQRALEEKLSAGKVSP